MELADKIRKIKLEKNLSTRQLAKLCHISPATISNIETEKQYKPSKATLLKLEAYFGIKEDDDYSTEIIPYKKIPILGEIAAGYPIFADQNIEDYIYIDSSINADFSLVVKGESMINAGIKDGSLVYIKKADMVNNGEIAAVLIGTEATLKTFYYNHEINQVVLHAENPNFKDQLYMNDEINEIKIIGKAVGTFSRLN